jgi:pyruvate/2-oxoglutarate dehydrogenase complex dihydrolipoamide dehydrogenase (E3) component
LIDSRAYPKFAQTLENKLRALKVDLVLGDEHVASPEFKTGKQGPGSVVKTKGGKELEADWVFLAVGNTPNTGLLRGVDSAALTAQSLIKVNDYLQVCVISSSV